MACCKFFPPGIGSASSLQLYLLFYPFVIVLALFTIAFALDEKVVWKMFTLFKLRSVPENQTFESRAFRAKVTENTYSNIVLNSGKGHNYKFRISKLGVVNWLVSIVFAVSLTELYIELRLYDYEIESEQSISFFVQVVFWLSMLYLFVLFGLLFVVNELAALEQEKRKASDRELQGKENKSCRNETVLPNNVREHRFSYEDGSSSSTETSNAYNQSHIQSSEKAYSHANQLQLYLPTALHTYLIGFLSFDEALSVAKVSKYWYHIVRNEFLVRDCFDSSDCHPMIMTDHRIWVMANRCPNLSKLYLRQCLQLTDQGITNAFVLQRKLQEFDCSGSDLITDQGLFNLAFHCPTLRTLRIAGCPKITNMGVELVLSRCFALSELNLASTRISNSTLFALRNSINIRSLDLSCCFEISDQGLSQVAVSCPRLQYLNLDRCVRLTNLSIKHLASGCRMLKKLHLRAIPGINNASLFELSQQLSYLQFLDVSECSVSDEGIAHMLNSPSLTSLNVNRPANGGVNVTDACFYILSAISNPDVNTSMLYKGSVPSSKLESLALSGSRIQFQFKERSSFGNRMLNRRRTLSFCNQYTPFDARSFGNRFPKLRSLNLCLCDRITDEFLFQFKSKDFFPHLKEIMLTGASVTPLGLEACFRARPNLSIMHNNRKYRGVSKTMEKRIVKTKEACRRMLYGELLGVIIVLVIVFRWFM